MKLENSFKNWKTFFLRIWENQEIVIKIENLGKIENLDSTAIKEGVWFTGQKITTEN